MKGNIYIMPRRLFTSESVTEGHPDKLCDQVSDSVLDAILAQDPKARVACETATTTGVVFVMGEITTDCYVDIPKVARQTVERIGYDRAKFGFDQTFLAPSSEGAGGTRRISILSPPATPQLSTVNFPLSTP